jgi:hypothetical protein
MMRDDNNKKLSCPSRERAGERGAEHRRPGSDVAGRALSPKAPSLTPGALGERALPKRPTKTLPKRGGEPPLPETRKRRQKA